MGASSFAMTAVAMLCLHRRRTTPVFGASRSIARIASAVASSFVRSIPTSGQSLSSASTICWPSKPAWKRQRGALPFRHGAAVHHRVENTYPTATCSDTTWNCWARISGGRATPLGKQFVVIDLRPISQLASRAHALSAWRPRLERLQRRAVPSGRAGGMPNIPETTNYRSAAHQSTRFAGSCLERLAPSLGAPATQGGPEWTGRRDAEYPRDYKL